MMTIKTFNISDNTLWLIILFRFLPLCHSMVDSLDSELTPDSMSCVRTPVETTTSKSSGSNGFTVDVHAFPVNATNKPSGYIPGEMYIGKFLRSLCNLHDDK